MELSRGNYCRSNILTNAFTLVYVMYLSISSVLIHFFCFRGIYTVALAAQHYSVPFIVAASIHKLTPQYFTRANKESFASFVSPQEILRIPAGTSGMLTHRKFFTVFRRKK